MPRSADRPRERELGKPEGKRIGTVTAVAGPGPNPLFVTGKILLRPAYKGASFGASVVVPQSRGRSTSATRSCAAPVIRIDPLTAQVTDVSDPFPTVLDPVGPNGRRPASRSAAARGRHVDREGFMLNPTNCERCRSRGS